MRFLVIAIFAFVAIGAACGETPCETCTGMVSAYRDERKSGDVNILNLSNKVSLMLNYQNQCCDIYQHRLLQHCQVHQPDNIKGCVNAVGSNLANVQNIDFTQNTDEEICAAANQCPSNWNCYCTAICSKFWSLNIVQFSCRHYSTFVFRRSHNWMSHVLTSSKKLAEISKIWLQFYAALICRLA